MSLHGAVVDEAEKSCKKRHSEAKNTEKKVRVVVYQKKKQNHDLAGSSSQ